MLGALRDTAMALGKDLTAILGKPGQTNADASRPPTASAEVAARARTQELAERWMKAVRALGEESAVPRAEALAAMRDGLSGEDDVSRRAALMALAGLRDVDYDKAAFRPRVLELLNDARGGLAVGAAYALFNTQREDGDLERIQALWERRDPEIDASISHLLVLFGDGVIVERSEEIVLELLSSSDPRLLREVLAGLWGARVGDALASRVVELSRDRASRPDAIYYALSTFVDKNQAVVLALLDALTDTNFEVRSRALWGLGHGVPRELQPQVTDRLVELHNASQDMSVRVETERLVAEYGGPEVLKKLNR